jgi:uncharacterized protein DUF6093
VNVAGAAEWIAVARTAASLEGLVDPTERRIYLDFGVDVLRGDTLGFRTWSRRALTVDSWRNAGVVVEFEDGPSWLPDAGTLARKGSAWNSGSNQNTITWTTVYSGPCRVDSAASTAPSSEIGQQSIQLQPYTVLFPRTLIDVEPGDRLTVTSSRDGRLLVRTLFVQRTLADSQAQDRVVLMREEQS